VVQIFGQIIGRCFHFSLCNC